MAPQNQPAPKSAESVKPSPMNLATTIGEARILRPSRITQTKDKKSSLVARVLVPIASFWQVEATVWARDTERGDGMIETEFTLSFPRGFGINDDYDDAADDRSLGDCLEAWKESFLAGGGPLDRFLDPKQTGNVDIKPGGARLVKARKAAAKAA